MRTRLLVVFENLVCSVCRFACRGQLGESCPIVGCGGALARTAAKGD